MGKNEIIVWGFWTATYILNSFKKNFEMFNLSIKKN